MLWAMDEAPDVPARLFPALVAVARYACNHGRGAYPAAATVARIIRKSESQAHRDMNALEKRGLLLPGNRRLVEHIRADRRPRPYDLAMSRGAPGCTPSCGPRGASGDGTGCIREQNGVHLDADEESLKDSRTARGRASAERARAGAPETRFAAPPCPGCEKPFSQEQLAGPEFRRLALAGDALCADCGAAP